MSSQIRTRFAPSPTGYLHVGGARTALYAWAYARHCGGQFILRVEDTDQERSTDASIDAILAGMQWLNLNYDEGPFYQTKRMDRYRAVLQQFLQDGHAYRCTCSKERLEQLRAQQMAAKEKPRYDGHCRNKIIPIDVPHVIRFKNPTDGVVVFDDLVRGRISINNAELDDLIIARTDGFPTYNFCVVVDDYDMQITHVIRGDDHINNTPRQINMLRAMNAALPKYAHLPMILGSDGQRLSKRHGAVSVMQFDEDGYLPEALLNYLMRLGWSHGDQEIFSRAEIIEFFDLTHINNSPAAFNMEKLNWLNQHYLKTNNPESYLNAFAAQLKKCDVDSDDGPALLEIISAQKERVKTLKEMAEQSIYFFGDLIKKYDEAAVQKHMTADAIALLRITHEHFIQLTTWDKPTLHQAIVDVTTQAGVKMGQLAQPLRVAATGGTNSPSIDLTLALIGKKRVLQRLSIFF